MMDAAYPIGFIGLGTMGEATALTLVKAGTRLLVWNRTRAKAEILAAAGGTAPRSFFPQPRMRVVSRSAERMLIVEGARFFCLRKSR